MKHSEMYCQRNLSTLSLVQESLSVRFANGDTMSNSGFDVKLVGKYQAYMLTINRPSVPCTLGSQALRFRICASYLAVLQLRECIVVGSVELQQIHLVVYAPSIYLNLRINIALLNNMKCRLYF